MNTSLNLPQAKTAPRKPFKSGCTSQSERTCGNESVPGPSESYAGPLQSPEPLIVAHRGASGYRPEHTLAAYKLAIEQGADFIEPDLVPTKDGELVARHENNIADTTNVSSHPEFAERQRTKIIDGKEVTGFFTEDFTLAELKTLKAKGRSGEAREYSGQFPIATFQEVIDLVKDTEAETGRVIGIYPETKHPSYFQSIGMGMEEQLVDTLNKNGYQGQDAPVIIQSFEVDNLKQLNEMTDVPIAQLIYDKGAPQDFVEQGIETTYDDMLTPEGLAEMATYADIVSPHKSQLLARDENNLMTGVTGVIADAHDAGLKVHAYTFDAENRNLPADKQSTGGKEELGDLEAEVAAFLSAGLDGLFTNHPDLGIAGRETFLDQRN